MIPIAECLRRARKTEDYEEGSALVMALVFMVLLGLVMAALLGFASTSFKHEAAVDDQGKDIYDADGAIDGAIARLEADTSLGDSLETCPTQIFQLNEAGNAPTSTPITVDYCPFSDSGASIDLGTTTTPKYALLTLGHTFQYASEKGYDQGSNNEIRMRGGAFSNSTFDADAGSSSSLVMTNGGVFARETCTGTISPACTITTTVEDDPEYASEATVTFTNRTVPLCIAGVATFLAGRYTSAADLNSLNCATWLFPTGVYYFDFQDSGQSNKRVWTLNGPTLRAGTYDTTTKLCTTGAQFIFGGESQWVIQDGTVDLCPITPVVAGQRISVYGAGSVKRLIPTTVTNVSGVSYSNTSSAKIIDGTTADAAMSGTNLSSALRLVGYSSPALSGKKIGAARLLVRHQDQYSGSGNINSNVTLGLSITDAKGRTTNASSGLTKSTSMHTDSIDLTGTWLTDPDSYGSLGVTVDYTASVASGRTLTEKLDGIWLQVIWSDALLTPATGCLIATSGGCDLIELSNNPDTQLSIRGTVYSPASSLDVVLNNVQEQVFSRGVVARSIKASITGSSTFTGQMFSLSAATGTGDRHVLLLAKKSGRILIRAEIEIDNTGNVTILTWRVLR